MNYVNCLIIIRYFTFAKAMVCLTSHVSCDDIPRKNKRRRGFDRGVWGEICVSDQKSTPEMSPGQNVNGMKCQLKIKCKSYRKLALCPQTYEPPLSQTLEEVPPSAIAVHKQHKQLKLIRALHNRM